MCDRPFKAIYSERYACDPDCFSAVVFRRCLFRHALPVALLMGGLRSRLFAEDRRAIEQFAIAHSLEQVRSTLEDLAYVNRTHRHWLRTGLNIRISGRRLYALAERLAQTG